MSSELLPCPFCGSRDMPVIMPPNNPAHEAWVLCRACDGSSKMCVAHAGKTAEEWAIEFWNIRTRAQPSATEFMEKQFADPEIKAVYDRLSCRATAQHPAVEALRTVDEWVKIWGKIEKSVFDVEMFIHDIQQNALTSQTPSETSEKP